MAAKWCTVTVLDGSGRRHSVDVLATSTFDAAHLYVVEAKDKRQVTLPVPTVDTRFEVVHDGKVYAVPGGALQRWIEKRRQDLGGPRAVLFRKRPTL